MSDYWIKLYVEILDDPKMGVLPDRLWRRAIELMLLAMKYHQDGLLPDTPQLAWLLRMNANDLNQDLNKIADTGILRREGDNWLVVNFKKRQAPVPARERKVHQREREHRDQYQEESDPPQNNDGHENVTNQSRSVRQKAETETETETETDLDNSLDRAAVVADLNANLLAATALQEKNLVDIYHEIGILEPTASQLAMLPWANREYVEAHIKKAQLDNIENGLLIHRIRSHDPLPKIDDPSDTSRYVTGPYAEFINH